ncbi:hypothetical protein [Clostridium drakei]|uniref:DNA adenine methylase n=1 Tax=Clostridium drakei TaxID=332101 RepID=A0A2U8DXG1_9CLOT|nr:hypothetical protein [Clostridium drakei]AWI06742.1 hypothetical protein B9W14_20325 [Clostridium drakei]
MGKKALNPLISPGSKMWAVDIYNPIILDCARRHNLSTYIEGSGAAARMLVNLERGIFKKRIYNEWEYDFCCYFAKLSDIHETRLLIKTIEELINNFSPEDLFELCEKIIKSEELKILDKTLVAAVAFIRCFSTYRANRKSFYADIFERNIIRPKRYLKLLEYNNALQDIVVTNTDCFNLAREYKNNGDFFYFGDHPYWGSKVYGGEADWNDNRYIEFVEIAKENKMKMMICDTKNPFYDELVQYYGWSKYFIKYKHNNMGDEPMPEHIWVNFDIPLYLLPEDTKKVL